MILAVDHVACSPQNPGQFLEDCRECGYQTVFSSADVENLDIKRRLLSHFAPKHNLTLMRNPADVPVEVLDHHGSSGGTGYLTRLGPCRFSCRTTDAEGSCRFWRRLGFCVTEHWSMTFRSILHPAALTLVLDEVVDGALPLLDDEGFNAVALLSSSAAREREVLAVDMDVTELRVLRVFDKELELFFARNPRGGELVEIVGLPTGR